MSRSYRMEVTITDFDQKYVEEIQSEAEEFWNFDWEVVRQNTQMEGGGEDCLGGGCSEQQFFNDLCKAIWKANKKYCKVELVATCLEELPMEHYSSSESDFEGMEEEIQRKIKEENENGG